MSRYRFTVFTKPWKTPIPALAAHVAALGFDGVELPVRPGYPVNPENAADALPAAALVLSDAGLTLDSVAALPNEATLAACAEARVPLLRVCVNYEAEETYLEGEERLRREFDALLPALERAGVTLGVQNHYGARDINHACGLRSLLRGYDPRRVAAVWDPAHNALQGEAPAAALDFLGDSLRMVNMKNAFWRRTNGPEAEVAEWAPYWTTGRHGLAHWPTVATELQRREYTGVLCLSAEYEEESGVDRLAAEDLAFARSLFTEDASNGAGLA